MRKERRRKVPIFVIIEGSAVNNLKSKWPSSSLSDDFKRYGGDPKESRRTVKKGRGDMSEDFGEKDLEVDLVEDFR
jgi:hypothetical protein